LEKNFVQLMIIKIAMMPAILAATNLTALTLFRCLRALAKAVDAAEAAVAVEFGILTYNV
jgi:hypothetical protein